MKIRHVSVSDLPSIENLDKEIRGENGGDQAYFLGKVLNYPFLVIEDSGKIVSFVTFDILEGKSKVDEFIDMNADFGKKWAFVYAFIVCGNYSDSRLLSELLKALEEFSLKEECTEIYVPLIKDRSDEGSVKFWKGNGYDNVGEAKWKLGRKKVDCLLFRKKF